MSFKLLLVGVIWLLSGPVQATPYALSYGGRLTDNSGKPVAGPVNLRVTFFRSVSGNDQVAVVLADFAGVTLQDGIFQIPISLSATDFHTLLNGVDQAFIQVEDLTHAVTYPRQKFSAVPYALKVPVDGESITFNAAGQLSLGNGSNTLKLPNTAGAANKILKSDGAGNLVWADDLSGGGAGSITGTEIQDGAITNADISAAAGISASKISGLGSLAAKSAVDSSDITDSSVTGTDIASGTITNSNISASAAIDNSKIAGLGNAATKNVGTTASDVAAGSHTHTMSAVTDAGSLATKSAVGSSDITDGSIVDADISASAAIANSKIAGLGSAATKNVGTTASDVAAGNHTHADATTGASGFMSASDKVRLNAAVVTTDTGTVSSTMITDGTITNSDVGASAAIAGTKVNPDFGNQNISTTGTISADTVKATSHLQTATSAGAPSATECDDSSEYGRLKTDTTNNKLYVCSTSGWVSAGAASGTSMTSKTANFSVTTNDDGKIFAIQNRVDVSLPAANTVANGFKVQLLNIGTRAVRVLPNGSDTINGYADLTLVREKGNASLMSDGVSSWILTQKEFAKNGILYANQSWSSFTAADFMYINYSTNTSVTLGTTIRYSTTYPSVAQPNGCFFPKVASLLKGEDYSITFDASGPSGGAMSSSLSVYLGRIGYDGWDFLFEDGSYQPGGPGRKNLFSFSNLFSSCNVTLKLYGTGEFELIRNSGSTVCANIARTSYDFDGEVIVPIICNTGHSNSINISWEYDNLSITTP